MSNARELAIFLNGVLALEAYPLEALLGFRVACSEALLAHPTVVVRNISGNDMVGMIGILNGFLLEQGEEVLVAVYDEVSGRLLRLEAGAFPRENKSGG